MCGPGQEAGWDRKSALCTYNVHSLACWLPKQVRSRGLTALNLELWVERFLGWLTRRTKYRLHGQPESILVKTYLTGCALQTFSWQLQARHSSSIPDSTADRQLICSVAELRHALSAGRGAGVGTNSSYDGGEDGKEQRGRLMGRGQRVHQGPSSLWKGDKQLRRSVRSCLQANGLWQQQGWGAVWEQVEVWQHKQARLESGQEVNSTSYGLSVSRDGTLLGVLRVWQRRGGHHDAAGSTGSVLPTHPAPHQQRQCCAARHCQPL